jgi:hypothetical protein
MAGNRPAAKIAIKPASGGERVYVAAAWRRDDGRMGGLVLDKRVMQIAVQLEGGEVIRVKREGGKQSHFIDLFLEDGPPRTQKAPPAAQQEADFGAGDFGSDDIPFDRIRGEVL